MNDQLVEDSEMPAEIDFSKGVRGLHHIPAGAKLDGAPYSVGKGGKSAESKAERPAPALHSSQ